MFCANSLTKTMAKDTLMVDEDEACILVHEIAPIRRWKDESVAQSSKLMVPRLISHYNMYMCAVDKVDLYRCICHAQHKKGYYGF